MNMNSESQDVMLMTQETVMFLLDLELKYFPGRILAQQHISHPLLDEMLNWGLISSYSLRKFCLERWCSSFPYKTILWDRLSCYIGVHSAQKVFCFALFFSYQEKKKKSSFCTWRFTRQIWHLLLGPKPTLFLNCTSVFENEHRVNVVSCSASRFLCIGSRVGDKQ